MANSLGQGLWSLFWHVLLITELSAHLGLQINNNNSGVFLTLRVARALSGSLLAFLKNIPVTDFTLTLEVPISLHLFHLLSA